MNTLLLEARHELAQKTLADIQRETAYKWAHRALAAYTYAAEANALPPPAKSTAAWLLDAHEYGHEALEHAALTEDPDVLADVQAIIRWGRNLVS